MRRPPMRGRRHDTIALPGGRRSNDPDPSVTENAMADNARINLDQEHEVEYWSEKLGVSRDELRRAIAQAGPMVTDIKQHLETKASHR